MHGLIKLKTKMSSLYACFGKESTCKRRRRGHDLRRKMVIVGDGACGKTCLVTRMTKGQFVDIGYIPTVFETEVVNVSIDAQDVELGIFDTAGQEDYDRLRPFSYYDVDVVLICFSLDDQNTLTNVVENWSPEIRYFCGKVPVILVGNKLDLRDKTLHQSSQHNDVLEKDLTSDAMKSVATSTHKQDGASPVRSVSTLYTDDLCKDESSKTTFVTRAQGVHVAKSIGAIAYYETSALTGYNVSDLLTATASAAMLGNKKAKRSKSFAKTLTGRELVPSLPLE